MFNRTMLDGTQFVEALGRLGYPGVSSLKGSEFDWLFDCSPGNLHLLRFVCGTLNRGNVVTTEEARAFRKLTSSGKPVLDEAALSEVLKTAGPADGTRPGPFSAAGEDVSLEDLEAELRSLRIERDLKQRRYNRLQAAATVRSGTAAQLSAERDRAAVALKEAAASVVSADNTAYNALLQNLANEASKLPARLQAPPREGTPVLLSQLSLESYLQQEELNTKALAAFTQKQFLQEVYDVASRADHLQLLDLSSCEGMEEEEKDHQEGGEKGESVVERRRTEVARLQWAHIVAQHQLLRARAEEQSLRAGLQWLSEKHAARSKRCPTFSASSLQVREGVARRELQAAGAELEALLRGPVPALLRERARLLNVPIVRGDLALQLARQDYYTSRQNQVRDYLLRQKASFDLLQLALQTEMRRWGALLRHLEAVSLRLVGEREEGDRRAEAMAHPDLALHPRPSPFISCKDASSSRLLQILEAPSRRSSGPGHAEPFRTYEALEGAASALRRDLRSTRAALEGASQQQAYTGSRLQEDCEALRRAAYTELQQLALGPQVCAAPGQELLCPNAQELTEALADAEAQLQKLHRLMQQMTEEAKARRAQLQREPLLRRERELYVLYHLNPRLLQKLVEDLEGKVAVAARR